MNNRKALIAFGSAIAQDFASGEMGEVTMGVCAMIAESPHLLSEVLDLAVAEMMKRKPKTERIAAYMILLQAGLESLRMRIEARDDDAAAILAALKGKLLGLARDPKVDPPLFMMVSSQFASAKLDLGHEIKTAVGERIAAGGDGEMLLSDADFGPENIEAQLAVLAKDAGGDSFALAAGLMEATAIVPDDHKIGMIETIAQADATSVRDAALAWLFDPSPKVRSDTAAALAMAGNAGLITPISARRLVAIRNWFPAEEKRALDAAIEASRKKGLQVTPAIKAEVKTIMSSAFDGSGAQSTFVVLKIGRKYAVAALLLKQEIGVRDAWVRRDLRKAEAEAFVASAGDQIELYQGTLDFVRLALPHFLAVNLGSGILPPFGLLDVIETIGLDVVNPASLSLDELFEQMAEDLEMAEPSEPETTLENSGAWVDDYAFMDSWFEPEPDVAKLLKGKRLSEEKMNEAVLHKIVDPRRRKWAERLGWSASVMLDGCHHDEASGFVLVARELVGKRPIENIPLMSVIAENSVLAAKARGF